MEYNKSRFQKTDDKKVLHKVKKQWVVLSMSLLAAIGGGALASHVTTHADTTNNNNQTNAQASTLKGHLNQSLTQNRQSGENQAQQTPKMNAQSIEQQASALHNNIVNHTVQNKLSLGQTNDSAQQKTNANQNSNQNANQANVLKEQTYNAPEVGKRSNLAPTPTTYNNVKYIDKDDNAMNNNVKGEVASDSGVTTSNLELPKGYNLDALPAGKNLSDALSSGTVYVSNNIGEITGTTNYQLNYMEHDGSTPEQAYNALNGQNSDRVSDGVANKSGDTIGNTMTINTGSALSTDTLNKIGITAPAGYSIYSNHNYTGTVTPTGMQWTNNDNSDKVSDSLSLNAVAKQAYNNNITVELLNQNGYHIPFSDGSTANDNGKVNNGNMVFNGANQQGNTINIIEDISSKVPSNYTLEPNQYNDYTFTSNSPQTIDLLINGKSYSNPSQTIDIKRQINDHNNNRDTNVAQPDDSQPSLQQLNNGQTVHYGDIIKINPANYNPDSSKYDVDGNDYNVSNNDSVPEIYVGTDALHPVNNDSRSNVPTGGLPSYNFDYIENANTGSPQDVKITYINQHGTKLNSNSDAQIQSDQFGKTIDLTQPQGGKNGVALPKGYQLNYSYDGHDAGKYTVHSDTKSDNKTYYVIGDQVHTNGNTNENNSLGTYNLRIKINTENSDGDTGSNVTKEAKLYTPSITGRVGDSVIITPSDGLDNGELASQVDGNLTSSSYAPDSKDTEYRVTFENDGKVTVGKVDPSNPSKDVSGSVQNDTASPSLSFTYAKNGNGTNVAPTKTIRINYLYQDQNYLALGSKTPTQKWIQLPNVSVSDRSNNGVNQEFSISDYEKNVPKGYQFVKVLNVNPNGKASDKDNQPATNSDGTPVEDNVNATSDGYNDNKTPVNFANDAVVNLEVIPTAGDITVNYYDQHGNKLNGTDVISGNSDTEKNNDNSGYWSRYGQRLNVFGNESLKDSKGNVFTLNEVPKGYHLVKNPTYNNGYQFTRQPQTINLTVIGNRVDSDTSSNQLTISRHEEAGQGLSNGDANSKSIYVRGRVADNTTIDPNDYAPIGYHAASSDKPIYEHFNSDGTMNLYSDPSDQHPISHPNQYTFNYVPDQNPNAANFGVRVFYRDQNGKTLNTTGDVVNGFYGENIPDITALAGMPSGYNLTHSDKLNYTLGYGQTKNNNSPIYLNVTGNKDTSGNPFTIYSIYKDRNGNEHTTTKQISNFGKNIKIGDSATVDPNSYNSDPTDYSDDPQDATQSVQIIPDVNGNPQLSTDKAVFFYDEKANAQNAEAKPIVIRYINQNGQQIGTNDVIYGKYGSPTINISGGNISGAQSNENPDASDNGNWNVPVGYYSSYNDTVSFGSDVQNVYVPVTGNTVNDTITVDQIEKDRSDQVVGYKKVSKTISGNVGDTVIVSPYNNIPNTYHPDDSDNDAVVTLGNNGHIMINGVQAGNTNRSNNYGISYVYHKDYKSGQNMLGTININYVDTTDPSHTIDTETDHGFSGNNFDISPYKNDIPSFASNYYHYAGKVSNSDTEPSSSTQVPTQFNGGTQNVYVWVTPNSKDTNNSSTNDDNQGDIDNDLD